MNGIGGLVGKKLGMLEVYDEHRRLIPVTLVEVTPCTVVQVKNEKKDGYASVQIGYGAESAKKMNKPESGHLKRAGIAGCRGLIEFAAHEDLQEGQQIKLDIFSKGDCVSVSALSKGKGFQGVIKRHHFAGGPASHGSMFHRAPGSLGQSSFPSRVFKNKKLPGQMGSKRVTVKGLQVVDVRVEENVLLVSGSVPGPIGGTVVIKRVGY